MDNYLTHYGIPRKSGRYPWGSGENPYQSNMSFMKDISDLQAKGLSEVEIARGMGMSTTTLRARKSIARDEIRNERVREAIKLKDKGYSNVAIAKKMGLPNESSVRSLLDTTIKARQNITQNTANMLMENVDKHKYVDVGVGVERHIGISRTRLNTAVELLEQQGYTTHYLKVEQLGTGKPTSMKILAPPDTEWVDVQKNRDKVKLINHRSEDGGRTFLGMEPVQSVDSKRIEVAYHEDGGTQKDGVIELRRGVDDISLGDARYAQVRVGVDGTHYLKGMAIYSDDLPDGVDIRYNVNKSKFKPDGSLRQPHDVFKKMEVTKDGEIDKDNPFGTTIRGEEQLYLTQKYYEGEDGKQKVSALNVVNEEGNWNEWSRTLSSQMLSKQEPALVRRQLKLAYDIKKEEYDEYDTLTNPVVKKRLLEAFADDADALSVSLKAASMPRQSNKVILPFPDMKEDEIYAPTYRNGEKVVLVRHPHGGIFEIPELTVNNKHKGAREIIPQASDAVGINHKVAERLSGADFDGDTVLVIPNPHGEIKNSSPLVGLKNFDPVERYPAYKDMPKMTERQKQQQMGQVSNLITDMTIKGADPNEIAAAVRHSMVVIDAAKHNLNYKQSAIDNRISSLKKKYQGGANRGASTIVSRASASTRPLARKELPPDPKTGKKRYDETGESYINKEGKEVFKTTRSTRMAEVDDARTLSSGTPVEEIYASHANKLKVLANDSRKKALAIKPIPYSPSAKKTYTQEVKSLDSKLNVALKNAPVERQAQLLANKVVEIKRRANPDMEADDIKKQRYQALEEARARTGAGKTTIKINDREWEAIQAGAISTNKLTQILDNTDLDTVKKLATPRTKFGMTTGKENRAKAMLARGYTQAEVADAIGVSVSTIAKL